MTTTLQSVPTVFTPSEHDKQLASQSRKTLSDLCRAKNEARVRMVIEEQAILVPAVALELLSEILDRMAKGETISFAGETRLREGSTPGMSERERRRQLLDELVAEAQEMEMGY
jgi:hypothetical protein